MLYIYALGAVIFLLLFCYGKVQAYRAKMYETQKQAALETAQAEGKIILNDDFRNQAVVVLKTQQQADNVIDQAKINAGDRGEFESDPFR